MSWADLINHLLREYRLSISELSRRSGVNLQSLLNVLSGKSAKLRLKGKLGIESAFGIRIVETDRGLLIQSPDKPLTSLTKGNRPEKDIFLTPEIVKGFDKQIGDAKFITVIPATRDELLEHGLYYIETDQGNFLRIYTQTGLETMGLFRAINPVEEQILFDLDAIKIYRVKYIKYD